MASVKLIHPLFCLDRQASSHVHEVQAAGENNSLLFGLILFFNTLITRVELGSGSSRGCWAALIRSAWNATYRGNKSHSQELFPQLLRPSSYLKKKSKEREKMLISEQTCISTQEFHNAKVRREKSSEFLYFMRRFSSISDHCDRGISRIFPVIYRPNDISPHTRGELELKKNQKMSWMESRNSHPQTQLKVGSRKLDSEGNISR